MLRVEQLSPGQAPRVVSADVEVARGVRGQHGVVVELGVLPAVSACEVENLLDGVLDPGYMDRPAQVGAGQSSDFVHEDRIAAVVQLVSVVPEWVLVLGHTDLPRL